MLLRFRFSNFRSFRSAQELSLISGPFSDLENVVRHPPQLKYGVLPCAAVYGANGSGKSNLIKAVAFMAGAVSFSHRKWEPDGPIRREAFMAEAASTPSEFEADFLLAGTRYRYGFLIDSARVIEEWLHVYPNGKKQTWFHRAADGHIAFSKNMPGENRTIEALTRKNSLFLSAAAQNNHDLLLPIYQWLTDLLFVDHNRSMYVGQTARLCSRADYFNEIRNLISAADLGIADMLIEQEKMPEKMKAVLTAIGTTLDPKEDGPESFPEIRSAIKLLHRFGDQTIPLTRDQESAGTIAYLALLGPVVDALGTGAPLLIDELDESLHPLLAIELIRLFNSPSSNPKGGQLIFNTHDTNLLSSGVLRRDQIWFTEKDKNASSHLFALSDFKPRLQENLRNGYLQGRYGAIPFINSDSFLKGISGM
jgi:uncharacterized protein